MAKNFLKEMFINEAKPALERHSGGSGSEKPSGTLPIFINGTFNVEKYASVEVNVESESLLDGIIIYDEITNDDIETIVPITKNYYTNAFIGNAEIISE